MMDAREILGVGPDAGEDEIRAAYVAKVKEHPPDRSPEEFERIRDAYDALRDPRRRVWDTVIRGGDDPTAPLVSLLSRLKLKPRFVGSQPWLEVLKGK